MAISDDIGTLNDLIDDPKVLAGGKATFKGKQYSLADLIGLRDDLEKQQQAEESAATKAKATALAEQRTARETQRETNRKVAQARGQLEAAEGNLDLAISRGDDIATPQANLVAAIGALRELNPSDEMLSKYPVETAPRVVAPRRATAGMRGEAVGAVPTAAVTPMPTGVTPTPVTPTSPTPTTPVTAPKVKGAKKPVVAPDAWKDILRQNFPSYSNDWLTDNAVTHFGQDVISLMIEAADPKGRFGGLKTDEGKAAYDKALRQTSYFLNTENSARAFDQATPANQQALINQKKLEITADLGDVGLDETTLNRVASEAARKGLTGLGLSQAVYANILKPTGAPSPVATRALQAADADRIRKIGRAYNYNVTDDEIKSILTGAPTPAGIVLTEEGLRQKAQNYAKGVMPQLAEQIDNGLTLDEIGGNYRRYAAQLLEQSEDQIDMFSGPYLQAFGTKETGQLSLGDWVERVKSDSRFGWQYTKQANQQATDVALSIARAFGKVQ